MGSPFTSKTPSSTYKDILQIDNSNAGIDNTLRAVNDGNGNVSALSLASGKLGIDGAIYLSGTLLTTNVSQLNKMQSVSNDGKVEANRVVVAGSLKELAFNGGSINLLGSGSSENGSISNFTIDVCSFKTYKRTVTAQSTGYHVLYPASGSTHYVTLASPLTLFSISSSSGIYQDSVGTEFSQSTYAKEYRMRLICLQDASGSREVGFSGITWHKSAWSDGLTYPTLNTAAISASANQMDMFELFTIDYGANWHGIKIPYTDIVDGGTY